MGFFDLDEFAQEAEKVSIIPHPLADKLSLVKKISYLGMLFFSAAINDGKVADGETKKFRKIGFSLKLQESDINETRKFTVCTHNANHITIKEHCNLPFLQKRDSFFYKSHF